MGKLIYLDNGATAWPKPDNVHQAMSDFYRNFGVNPGRSGYDLAIEAEQTVSKCRKQLTEFFNGDDPNGWYSHTTLPTHLIRLSRVSYATREDTPLPPT